MARSATCRCGTELKAPDGHRTVRGKCPNCGETVVILPSGTSVQSEQESTESIAAAGSTVGVEVSPPVLMRAKAQASPTHPEIYQHTIGSVKTTMFWTDVAAGMLYLAGMLSVIVGALGTVLAIASAGMNPDASPIAVLSAMSFVVFPVGGVFVLSASEILSVVAKKLG